MKPPDESVRTFVGQWLARADDDFQLIELAEEAAEFPRIVAFHAQQAVEKYLQTLLVYRHLLP